MRNIQFDKIMKKYRKQIKLGKWVNKLLKKRETYLHMHKKYHKKHDVTSWMSKMKYLKYLINRNVLTQPINKYYILP